MVDTNRALISKNAWNIISSKKSLSVQLFTAKYLGLQTFLNSNPNNYNPSWIWKDIWKTRDLILKGACFHISFNSTVIIWDDPWIPTLDSFKPTPLLPSSLTSISDIPSSHSLVRSLITPNSNSWNISLLVELFPPNVVNEIRKISISSNSLIYPIFWKPSKSGIFTSKSAFLADNANRIHQSPLLPTFSWKNLWAARIHNRHKLLIWRIVHDILPTRAKLSSFFPLPNSLCPLCDMDLEDVEHLFLKCPYIQQLWFTSKWSFCLTPFINEPIANWIALILRKNGTIFPSDNLREEF